VLKPISVDLAVIPKNNAVSDVMSPDDKLLNMFWLILLGLALPNNPITFLFGCYSLARSIFDVYKDCKDGIHLDCVLHGVDAVVAAAFGVYKLRSGVAIRDSNGNPVYSTLEFNGRHLMAHIMPIEDSLKLGSMATTNNGTWAHHASFYHGNITTHHLMYRTAHHDDLGFKNDGSYHHYRVRPTAEYSKILGRREEDKSNNLVTDYIWRDM